MAAVGGVHSDKVLLYNAESAVISAVRGKKSKRTELSAQYYLVLPNFEVSVYRCTALIPFSRRRCRIKCSYGEGHGINCCNILIMKTRIYPISVSAESIERKCLIYSAL